MLTRDQFFALAPAPRFEDVQVPGLGVVRVRMLTAGDRDRLEAVIQGQGKDAVRARIVVAATVAEDGSPLFTVDDVARITAMPAYIVEPIVDAAVRLNAISSTDLEDLEKN